jgi:hypothetical protein
MTAAVDTSRMEFELILRTDDDIDIYALCPDIRIRESIDISDLQHKLSTT